MKALDESMGAQSWFHKVAIYGGEVVEY